MENIECMKKNILFIALLALAACSSPNLEFSPAKQKVEGLIKDIDNAKFKEVSDYYTEQFLNSETFEARTAKFKQFNEIYGKVVQIHLIDSSKTEKKGGENSLILTYRIKHERLSTVEVFNVVKDGGDYKIAGQSIKATEN